MRLSIAIFAMTLAGTAVFSEELSVRSGNHPEFSRLTLPITPDQSWDARRTGTAIRVTITGHTDGFDTQTVFARMRRDRISDLKSTENSLELEIACDCEATAFVSTGLLVIDVADPGTRLAAAPITVVQDNPLSASRKMRKQSAMPSPGDILPWLGSGAPAMGQDTDGTSADSTIAPEVAVSSERKASDHATLLSEMQQNLSREIALAASTGLLENSLETPQKPSIPPAEAATRPASDQMQPSSTRKGSNRNLRITSSMDFPSGTPQLDTSMTISGHSCPSDDLLPVDTWGGTGIFADEIGQARNNLFDARDHLDPKAAVKLAKTYIYFGFGAEALDALALSEELINKYPELVSLANIMERGHINGPNPLGSYTDCNSDVALWAILAYPTVSNEIPVNTKAVLRAVNKLPKHLRHFIAPAVSDRLLQIGDSGAAATAMRSIERLPGPLSPRATLAKAQIAVENGTPATEMFEEVINTNSDQSAEALISLMNAKLKANEAISNETAELVEAYAQELRGTDLGQRLRIVEVLALGQAAQFDAAFDALEGLLPTVSPHQAREMRQALLEQLSRRGDDIAFLQHMFPQDFAQIDEMTPATKLLMAERLIDLGFAAQVQKILSGVPDRPRNTPRQLLAAKAAIMLEQPFQAQAALVGIEDPQVAMLMAQAKEMTGAYSEAAELFAESDAPEDAIRAAWLSDDWRNLVSADTPGFGPITQVAAPEPVAATADAGPLNLAGAALEESQSARTALSALLSDPLLAVETDTKIQSQ